tara:strand:+ start:83 stop:460 length:378 start_codon:yes stop_codon:yes gene_type:complete
MIAKINTWYIDRDGFIFYNQSQTASGFYGFYLDRIAGLWAGDEIIRPATSLEISSIKEKNKIDDHSEAPPQDLQSLKILALREYLNFCDRFNTIPRPGVYDLIIASDSPEALSISIKNFKLRQTS